MKKIAFLLLCAVLCLSTAIAQKTTVRGKVTDSKGSPVPSATVREKGTQNGVSADASGAFVISADSKAILQISATGFATSEISAANAANVVLTEVADNLSEVVVTALGIRREKKALGYSVQEVKGDNLTVAKSVDVSSSIVGKVAGVQLQGSPSSTFDNANILIRGVTGLDVANPIFVVDGTITDQSAVLMDNVESLSVLKGPAATALYGQRAANGVVVISMKKGARKKRTGVEVNLGATSESISLLPPYQNKYAGGYTGTATTAGTTYDAAGYYLFHYNPAVHPASWAAFDNQRMLEYGADESWGPKIDGQQYRAYWSWYPGAEFGKLTPNNPQPDNVKNFFQSGRNLNNSIALTSSADNYNFRFSYGNQNRTLVIPGAKRDQHQLGINGSYDLSKAITLSTDMIYTFAKKIGQPTEGYNLEGRNITQNFNQWFQRQLDIERMKTYREPDGSLNSWNIGDPNATPGTDLYQPQYWDNPYFVLNEVYGTESSNRMVGNVGLTIRINSHLSIQSNLRIDQYQFLRDFRVGTGGLQLSSYEERQRIERELNYETNIMYKNKFGNFSVDALLGGNIRNNTFDEMFWRTEGGLTAPNYFTIGASVARPTVTRGYIRKKINSILSKVSLGYQDLIYVEGTVRRDANSALPSNNNTFYYPSVSTSFIFTELLKNTGTSSWLTYGKLRASYASVGSDLDFNSILQSIDNSSLYGSNPSNAIGNQYRSGNIIPALTRSYEVGAEFKFFKRIGFEFAWYQNNNTNQIIPLTVSPTSGYSTAQVNAGNIQNTGFELSVNGTPISTRDFTWEVSLNWAQNRNKVIELYGDQKNYVFKTESYDTRLEHRKGGDWGTYVSRKWRTDPTKGGQYLINPTGQPEYDINQDIGTVLPKWTGGMFHSLHYKGFDLNFSLDFQSGGLFYSATRNFNTGAGLSEETIGTNDKGFDWRDYPGTYTIAGGSTGNGGIRIPGIFSTGTAAGQPNNRYLPARNYWYTARQRDASNYLLDASYIKLREVRFGYAIPTSALASLKVVKNANIGIIVSNAWLIWANAKKYGIDPSELEVFYREGGQLSASRQIGVNLRVGF